MIIGYLEIEITETEKARKVYQSVREYSFNESNKDVQIVSFSRDDMKYTWDECIIQLENTCVKLHLSHPNDNYYNKPKIAKLCINVFGEEQARQFSIKRLEEIAGEKFN